MAEGTETQLIEKINKSDLFAF